MFYLELILAILSIISFLIHLHVNDLYSFVHYTVSSIFFAFLSLQSIYEIVHERSLSKILDFIINDQSGMYVFVEIFFIIFVFCIILICYNLYVVYKEETKPKK